VGSQHRIGEPLHHPHQRGVSRNQSVGNRQHLRSSRETESCRSANRFECRTERMYSTRIAQTTELGGENSF
jgi:hypothetical protein